MTRALDSPRPFSTELQIIRRLDCGQYKAGVEDGPRPSFSSRAQHRAALAPRRDDLPLLDPSCSQLSAGAEAVLGLKGRARFINFNHVASDLRVPPGGGERPQTVSNPHSVCVDVKEEKAWNSRMISDAVLRARASGKVSGGSFYICVTRGCGAQTYRSVFWRGVKIAFEILKHFGKGQHGVAVVCTGTLEQQKVARLVPAAQGFLCEVRIFSL